MGEISPALEIGDQREGCISKMIRQLSSPSAICSNYRDYTSLVGSNGPLMSSYFMKPPSKGLFCGSRGCEGQTDDEMLPQFCLYIQPPDVAPSLDHPCPHHPVHHLITHPSSLRYSWQFPQGRRCLCPCTFASCPPCTFGRTQEDSIAG